MGLHKILRIVALIFSVVGIVFLAMIVSAGDDVVRETGEGLDGLLYVAYLLFAIVLFFVIIFVLKGLLGGNIKKTLIVLGAFLAVVLISYVMADGVETEMRDGEILSANGSKWVSTGLNVFSILGVVAIGSMVVSSIKKVMIK